MRKKPFNNWILCIAFLLLTACRFSSLPRLSAENLRPDNASELELLAEYPLQYSEISFAFSPNGERIAINDGLSVSIVNLSDLSLISKISPPFRPKITMPEQDEERIRAIAFLSNETIVTGVSYSPYGGNWLGSLRLWDIPSGQEIALLDEESAIWNLMVTPDGRYLAFQSTKIIVMRLEDQSIIYEGAGTNHFLQNFIAFTPDSKEFAIWSGGGLKIINLESQEERFLEIDVDWYELGPIALKTSPNSQTIAVWSDTEIKLYDLASLEHISDLSFDYGGFISELAFWDDDFLIVGGSGNPIDFEIFNFRTGQTIASMDGHEDTIFSVASHPDNSLIVTGSRDNTVKLWDISSESPSLLLEFSINWAVYHLAFCPKGNCLIASSDRLLQIWGRLEN